MKRTISKVLLILIAIIVITGCTMKENLHMVISQNKNVKVSIITAMDDEMIDAMMSMEDQYDGSQTTEKKEYTDEERWEYLGKDENSTFTAPKNYTVKKYDKDGFKGYIAEQDFGSIDKLSTTSATERQNILSDEDMFEGNLFIKNGSEYTSNMKVDLSEEDENVTSYESYGAAFDLKLIIEFPKVPISHNASEVSADGKTLTWDLLKAQDIEFTFDFDKDGTVKKENLTPPTEKQEEKDNNNLKLILIIAGICGAFFIGMIAIVIVVILVVRKKPQPIQITQTIENKEPIQNVPEQNNTKEQEPKNITIEQKPAETNINIEESSKTTVEVETPKEENIDNTQNEEITPEPGEENIEEKTE